MGAGETWGDILRPQMLDLILLTAFIALAMVSFFRKSVALKYVTFVAAVVACGAMGTTALAHADPYEIEPDLAKRDADYAAAKVAIDHRDWAQAVASLKKTEVREPDRVPA